MPTNKSAAVPFINQKGERSVKRVKVERYVAGKKPSYAKDDDEEYYTTDEEDDDAPVEEDEQEQEEDEDRDRVYSNEVTSLESRTLDIPISQFIDEDEDDDPRFRKLKQVESKSGNRYLLEAQTRSEIKQSSSGMVTVIDDDEEEEEIRQRHMLARSRILEEPIGPQLIKTEQGEDFADQNHDTKKFVDLLEDFEPTLIEPRKTNVDTIKEESCDNEDEENEYELDEEEKRKEEEENLMKSQIVKRIEEDSRREKERLALKKFDVGMNDASEVITDDEDSDTAYENWKLREIKRVLRDRAARALELQKRKQRTRVKEREF